MTVQVSGVGELVAVEIKAGGFDGSEPDDLADLGDMIVAAYRDAKAQADAIAGEALGPLAGGLRRRRAAGPARPARLLGTRVYEGVVQDLIDELGRLPGVGPKGAQRIAFHLLQADPADVRRLADVLIEVKAKVKFCSICFNVSEDDQCRICRDPRRDPSVLCVVEEYKDVVAIERTREFRGRYHVLGGAISPIDGIGPEQLRIRELMVRLADGSHHRDHPGDRSQPRGRGDCDVPHPDAAALGLARDAFGEWTARRWRPGVCRRGDAGPRVRRKAIRR